MRVRKICAEKNYIIYWCPVNLFHKSKKNGADLAQRFAPNCAFLYYPKLNAHNEQKYLF